MTLLIDLFVEDSDNRIKIILIVCLKKNAKKRFYTENAE